MNMWIGADDGESAGEGEVHYGPFNQEQYYYYQHDGVQEDVQAWPHAHPTGVAVLRLPTTTTTTTTTTTASSVIFPCLLLLPPPPPPPCTASPNSSRVLFSPPIPLFLFH